MVRVINGQGETIMIRRHVELEIPCAVRVVIDESADQTEAATTLHRIASMIEGEGAEETGVSRSTPQRRTQGPFMRA